MGGQIWSVAKRSRLALLYLLETPAEGKLFGRCSILRMPKEARLLRRSVFCCRYRVIHETVLGLQRRQHVLGLIHRKQSIGYGFAF